MSVKYFFFALFALTTWVLSGQDVVWKAVIPNSESSTQALNNSPIAVKAYSVDETLLFNKLQRIKAGQEAYIKLPMGHEGVSINYRLIYSPVMMDGLQNRFPDIMTFKVVSLDGDTYVGRLSWTESGVNGVIHEGGKDLMIRPDEDAVNSQYRVYDLGDKLADVGQVSCGTRVEAEDFPDQMATRNADGSRQLRTYRLAISCTSAYAGRVGRTMDAVMGSVVEAINLTNFRYNIDAGMHFVLIDQTPELFHISAENEYFSKINVGYELLQQNQDFLNLRLSSEDYDVAQVFTGSCTDVGGVVWGRACRASDKARGVSCRTADKDYFFVTFQHELAHQFAGGHTFNSCNGSSQYNPNSSYEPGAGSTILSYGNNCGSDNVGERANFFHVVNIIEMTNFARNFENVCGELSGPVNFDPVVSTFPSDTYTIPILTPYELLGSAIDDGNTSLTYNWEQFDVGAGEPLGTNFETGPLVRTAHPRNNGNKRLIPALNSIITNYYDVGERLPEVSREMNFKLTVRDNNPEVGGNTSAHMRFFVTDQAGPFVITFPNVGIDTSFELGQLIHFQWDVANTDQFPVNCKTVNIIASFNNGATFSDTLAANTPNDGSEWVMITKNAGKYLFKVQSADNIFLDISRKAFRVNLPEAAGFGIDAFPHDATVCKFGQYDYLLKTITWKGFETPYRIEILDSGHPDFIVSGSQTELYHGAPAFLRVDTRHADVEGHFVIKYMAIAEGVDTLIREVRLEVKGQSLEFVGAAYPQNGQLDIALLPELQWVEIPDAEGYQIQVSDQPDFLATNVYYASQTVGSNYFTLPAELSDGTVYYWRVRGLGACGSGNWSAVMAFRTNTTVADEIKEINNTQLKVRTNSFHHIGREQLIYEAVQLPTTDLAFVALNLPAYGHLELDNIRLEAGGVFHQSDIDRNALVYVTKVPDYQGYDGFNFVVHNNASAMIGPRRLDIDVNEANPLITKNIAKNQGKLSLSPNPANTFVDVLLPAPMRFEEATLKLLNANGQVLTTRTLRGGAAELRVSVKDLPAGVYVVWVTSAAQTAQGRIIKL